MDPPPPPPDRKTLILTRTRALSLARRTGEPVEYRAWTELADRAEPFSLPEGAAVFEQGDVPRFVYFIEGGKLQVRRPRPALRAPLEPSLHS